jgi:SNF2 family DNA or RNA helicase
MQTQTQTGSIIYDRASNQLVIFSHWEDRERCLALRSREYVKLSKAWMVPASYGNIEEVLKAFPDYHIDDSVVGVYQKEREKNDRFMFWKEQLHLYTIAAKYEWFGKKPFPHQIAATMAMLQRDKVLLNDEQGLGKSKIAIDVCVERMKRGEVNRAIVICPATLKFNWVDQLEEHCPPDFRSYTVVEGTTKKRYIQLGASYSTRWLIINYDLARIHGKELVGLIQDQALILDEAHKVKNRKAQITKAIQSFRPRLMYPMTGTPVANRPEDIYQLSELVEPGLLGLNFYQFKNRYCKVGGWDKKEIIGYKNLDEMQALLATTSIRRLKRQVTDLPEKLYETRDIPLDGAQAREYKRMRDEFVAFYRELPERDFKLHARDARSQLIRLQQIADGFVQVGDKPPQWFDEIGKVNELDDIVSETMQRDDKIVIWTRFVAVSEMLARRYEAYGSVRLWGGIAKKTERMEIVRRFQTDPSCRVFVSQVDTGGIGLTLTGALTEVFYDRPWSLSANEQAEDRLHRLGTRGVVSVITLAAQGTIDHYVLRMLRNKVAWSNAITGDDTRLTRKAMLSLLGEDVA